MGKRQGTLEKLILAEFVNWWAWEFLGETVLSAYDALTSVPALLIALALLAYFYWPDIRDRWWKPKAKQAGVDVAMPETKRWITWHEAHWIVRDHPATFEHAPRPRDYNTISAEIQRAADNVKYGPSPESKKENSIASAILDKIAARHPQAQKGDLYSKEVVEWSLNRYLLDGRP